MEILTLEFISLFWVAYGLIHGLIVLIIAACAYGVVRLEGFTALAVGVFGLDMATVLMVIVSTLASVSHASKRVLVKMGQCERGGTGSHRGGMNGYRKVIEKSVRGLRELRISMGSCFYYDKGMLLTTLQIILQISVNLILLH